MEKPDCIDPDVHENMTAYAQIERKSAPPLPLRKPTPLIHVACRLCLVLASESSTLLLHALLPPLAGGLGLRTLGVHLLLQDPLAGLLGLGLVDLGESQFLLGRAGAVMSWANVRARRGHACA